MFSLYFALSDCENFLRVGYSSDVMKRVSTLHSELKRTLQNTDEDFYPFGVYGTVFFETKEEALKAESLFFSLFKPDFGKFYKLSVRWDVQEFLDGFVYSGTTPFADYFWEIIRRDKTL